MSYVDTVDYQAKKFGASATVSIFVVAAASFLLDLSILPDPPKLPEKDRTLVVFPVPGEKERKTELKVFDVPKVVKPDPKPKPQPVEQPQPEPPAEPQKASSDQVDKSKPDPDQAEALAARDLPTFWTPPPPKVAKAKEEIKEVKKVDLPRLVVNDARSEQKMDVNRPPRLVQAREQRMDDAEVLSAVRRLQQQLAAAPRPSGGTQPTVSDQVIQDGTVALRFQVLANGSISGCSVVVTSGSEVLDKRACDLVSTFVYEAGTDEKGAKVDKTMIETIEWLGGEPVRGSDGRRVEGVVPSRGTPPAAAAQTRPSPRG